MQLLVLALALCTPLAVEAGPVVFKCKDSSGAQMVDLQIDLDARKMKWGELSNYAITNVTETHITGVEQRNNTAGGEVWVLDRTTGDFKRAAVFMGCTDKNCQTPTLTAVTYSGRCARPLL